MFELTEPEKVGLSSDRLRRISEWMQQQVNTRRLPGVSVLVHRRGRTAFFDATGFRDVEAEKPVEEDTIFRIYSMTKPVTSVAAMMLFEEGRFQLDDPLAKFIPEFEKMQVWAGGTPEDPIFEPARELIRIRHLFTHTSGLTYGFMMATPVDALYRKHRIGFPGKGTLEEMTARLAQMPLLCNPGTEWNYGVSTDVLGRLVEVLSGQSLDRFFEERIFAPLGMKDTAFQVPEEKIERFSALYEPPEGEGRPVLPVDVDPSRVPSETKPGLKLLEPVVGNRFTRPAMPSGGGGLTSTTADYLRFCRMLMNKGELDGERLLGRKTVEFMTINHLPDNRDMAAMGQPRFSEAPYDGVGFGLGFSVVIDPAKSQALCSAGEYAWGGAASTGFWIDPAEEMIVILMTQLMPSSAYPLRRQLRSLTYQATID